MIIRSTAIFNTNDVKNDNTTRVYLNRLTENVDGLRNDRVYYIVFDDKIEKNTEEHFEGITITDRTSNYNIKNRECLFLVDSEPQYPVKGMFVASREGYGLGMITSVTERNFHVTFSHNQRVKTYSIARFKTRVDVVEAEWLFEDAEKYNKFADSYVQMGKKYTVKIKSLDVLKSEGWEDNGEKVRKMGAYYAFTKKKRQIIGEYIDIVISNNPKGNVCAVTNDDRQWGIDESMVEFIINAKPTNFKRTTFTNTDYGVDMVFLETGDVKFDYMGFDLFLDKESVDDLLLKLMENRGVS